MELLPFVDILKVFNNPINEEQAWAVCYQCAHFLQRNSSQDFYQDVYDSGIHSIWLSRHGDVLLRKGPADPNGSGKGPPSSNSPYRPHLHPATPPTSPGGSGSRTTTTPHHKGRRHVLATETDAVQTLGTAIFEALDYGIDQSEERQLSPELESMIVTMTNTAVDSSLDYDTLEAASNGDDEGIEKDADVETTCTVSDVIKMCVRHLSSKQDASHHYKAVCRALATEAGELFTFLDKVATGKEQLCQAEDEDARRLEELQRADWACLWVQVMRSLRQGVRLKKVEHVHLPPLEYELTPFEMILEDIRSRRYTLTKIMVNGDIPHKVKNDAHAVILNFIRSRPPLKKVDERKLKPKPPSPPDPHELLLREIRSRPKLRPVRAGRLVVEKSDRLARSPSSEEEEPKLGALGATAGSTARPAAKKVIKPDFNLLLNNSFEESSDDEDRSSNNSPGSPEFRHHYHLHSQQHQQQHQRHHLQQQPHLYPRSDSLNMTPPPRHSWQRAVTREALLKDPSSTQPGRASRLQRRHTITVCEAPAEHQVAQQELPVLQELQEEEEEASPVRERPGGHGGRGGGGGGDGRYPYTQPGTPQASLSDGDIKAGGKGQILTSTASITLRQTNPGLVRRASFEHRRSLSSQGSVGLSAIPEQEDDASRAGGGQDPGLPQMPFPKGQEQCPPPNPSPPCKGRAKQGLAMVGMKPSGGPYHPCNHHYRTHSVNAVAATTPATTPTTATTSTAPHAPSSSSASMLHASANYSSLPQSKNLNPTAQHVSHAPSNFSSASTANSSECSEDPVSLSHSSAPSSIQHRLPQPYRSTSLDQGLSSQSPTYAKNDQSSLPARNSGHEDRVSRWRAPREPQPQPRQTANTSTFTYSSGNQSHSNVAQNAPTMSRRWVSSIPEDGPHQPAPSYTPDARYSQHQQLPDQPYLNVGSGYYPEGLSQEESRQKRLSLDAGMSMYYEEALSQDHSVESAPCSPGRDWKSGRGAIRRTSVGLDRGVKGRAGFRKMRSPEEVERVSRWRDLQEDDRQARMRRHQETSPTDDSAHSSDTLSVQRGKVEGSQSPALGRRQAQPSRRSGVSAVTLNRGKQHGTMPMKPENTDVLQQRMADEEARFERWRRLEEGTGSHPLLDHLHTHDKCGTSDVTQSFKAQAQHGSEMGTSDLRVKGEPPVQESRVSDPHVGFPYPVPPSASQHVPVHDSASLPRRWQNPVECLSLTLEEVTHIRSVLTKAELESLISHPDLYQQVSKNKLCFTCKTTRFALFGEWGTKCKFCKRTVCSKCLRKMNVPADHFRNIPVYTLSPTPLTQEMEEFIQEFIKGAPTPSVPPTRDHSPARGEGQRAASPLSSGSKATTASGPGKLLQRSQSAMVSTGQKGKSGTGASSSSLSASLKGPVMAVCCDCKGMLMEIIRATRASLTIISSEEGRASLLSATAADKPPSLSPKLAALNPAAKHYLSLKSKIGSE